MVHSLLRIQTCQETCQKLLEKEKIFRSFLCLANHSHPRIPAINIKNLYDVRTNFSVLEYRYRLVGCGGDKDTTHEREAVKIM